MPGRYCANLKPWRIDVLPVVPDEWEMLIKKSCKTQFNVIKDLLKRTQTVVIATDADREGELIAREVLDYCHFKGGIKRLWLSALDDASITKALHAISDGKNTENLYYAGLGRQRADWLIGMNMTMAASVLYGSRDSGVLSVGRVQTPTLKLIVDRDCQIEHFVAKDYFELIAQFTTNNQQSFYAKWQAPQSECDADGYCVNKNVISSFAAKVRGKTGKIEKFSDEKKRQAPPVCLSLSQLQKLASHKFNMSAQKTLDIAQALYENHKATTYPRTDCGYLPESQFSEASIILDNLKKVLKKSNVKNNNQELLQLIEVCDVKFKSPAWNDKKITAHHGIIPTLNPNVDIDKMNDSERNLFELICRYYLAQFLGDYQYSLRSVAVLCEGELFKASNHTMDISGWKSAFKNSAENLENDDDDTHLSKIPDLEINESARHSEEKIITKQTKPLARLTEGTLIDAMKSVGKNIKDEKLRKVLKETAGIGTEATRANIIKTLFDREYIEKKGKQLFSTEKGRKLIACLPPIVCDPALTAQWEQALDTVSQGQLKLESFVYQQNDLLKQMLAMLQSAKASMPVTIKIEKPSDITYFCESCRAPLYRKKSSKTNKHFWGCSRYPSCRTSSNDTNGKPERHFINATYKEKA